MNFDHVTLATLEGERTLSGWWTDLKRSSAGQFISDIGDSVGSGASSLARMTSNAYDDYVRPGANILVDSSSFAGNVLTGQWGTAAKQAKSGFEDTLDFLNRQGDGGSSSTSGETLPETDSGVGIAVAGIAAVGLLYLLTRKNKGK